jgi:hypothetical protein
MSTPATGSSCNANVLSVKTAGKSTDFGLLLCGYLPLDMSTFARDNSSIVEGICSSTHPFLLGNPS